MVEGGKPDDYIGLNAGVKPYDGISGRRLNLIMLEAAIKKLPGQLRLCVDCRWVDKKPLGVTLRLVGVSKSEYYRRCGSAVDFIHKQINGRVINYKALCRELVK